MKLSWKDVRHVAAARGSEVVELPDLHARISKAAAPEDVRRQLVWVRRACAAIEATVDQWETENEEEDADGGERER